MLTIELKVIESELIMRYVNNFEVIERKTSFGFNILPTLNKLISPEMKWCTAHARRC